MRLNITIVQADITAAPVDAIVNAANERMLGGGGVDGAIHRAAGPQLKAYCRQIPVVNGCRCPVGEARITPGFSLPARWVIHTVGPRYEADRNPEKLLESAYRNSLTLAQDNDCQSIAFPAISCGVYGYPHDEAAKISLSVTSETKWQAMDISFYLFSKEMLNIWVRELGKLS